MKPPHPRSEVPFLTLPTACSGPLSTVMEGVSWVGAPIGGRFDFQNSLGAPLAGLEGCDQLPFEPSLALAPEQPSETQPQQAEAAPTTSASTPTGLNVDVKVHQQGTLSAGAARRLDVQSATVTLPEGMLLSPSAANGLQACSEAQIGYEGPGGEDPLSPGAPEPLRFSTEQAACPPQSKLGSVRIKTPLLSEELERQRLPRRAGSRTPSTRCSPSTSSPRTQSSACA